MVTTADVLRRSLELVREHGWGKGDDVYGSSGKHCIVTAIGMSMCELGQMENFDMYDQARDAVAEAIDTWFDLGQVPLNYHPVVYFNDHVARGSNDVEQMILEAIHRV